MSALLPARITKREAKGINKAEPHTAFVGAWCGGGGEERELHHRSTESRAEVSNSENNPAIRFHALQS